ncbi:MAG: ROK family protein [Thermoleophilia bacterium]
MSFSIGIDVGVSKVSGARVNIDTGRIVDRRVMDTRPSRGADVLLGDVVGLSRGLGADAMGIGIALPEHVGAKNTIESAEFWDWRESDMETAFEEIKPDWRFLTDAYAAGVGEAKLGAGRELETFLYVHAGQNVSAALMQRSRLAPDSTTVTAALNDQALEATASGIAIAREADTVTAAHAISDPTKAAIVAAAASALAAGIVATGIPVVIMGGGVGLNDAFRALVVAEVGSGVELLPAALGADATLIGAALAAF